MNDEKITYLLIGAIREIPTTNFENLVICPVGKPYDSAVTISYSLGKSLNLNEEELANTWTSIDGLINLCKKKKIQSVVFIDDNITSGSQFRQFLSELLLNDVLFREHTHISLSDEDKTFFRKLQVYYVVAVDLSNRPDYENSIMESFGLSAFKVISGLYVPSNCLQFGNHIWDSFEESEHAVKLIKKISVQLYKDKNWNDDKVNDRLLGYGNLGKLIVFSHNVPKSLLPIFWKYGVVDENKWFPLFPERKEWSSFRENILDFRPYEFFFAKQIAGGAFGKTNPICSAYININGERVDTINIPITSDAKLRKVVDIYTDPLTPLEHIHAPIVQQKLKDNRSLVSFSRMYDDRSIPSERYTQYNNEVNMYNHNINSFVERIHSQLWKMARIRSIPFRIFNQGTAPATEVILRLKISDKIKYVYHLEPLEKLPEKPSEPITPYEELTVLTRKNFFANKSILHSALESQNQSNIISQEKVKIDIDGNEVFVSIYFKKIVQHTYRDFTLKYLYFNDSEGLVTIPYQLLCEQSAFPVEGTFSLSYNIVDGLALDEDVVQVMRGH